MLGTYDPPVARGLARGARWRSWFVAAGLAAALAACVVLIGLGGERVQGSREMAAAFPAPLVQRTWETAPGAAVTAADFRQPSDVAVIGSGRFLLDAGNARVLELNSAGTVLRTLNGPALDQPLAMASDGQLLYVASSGSSQIQVIELSGRVASVVDLTGLSGAPVRPIGLAVDTDGDIFISDAANHRVLRYSTGGQLTVFAGSGVRAGGTDGFNVPGGVATDAAGNVYVADILNGRVVKLSPGGAFIRQFGQPGDTAGTLSRPKDVAVDGSGNVYVSDSLLAAVQVFAPDGGYLGFIGRQAPAASGSKSLFLAPAGVEIAGGHLYAVDRFAGLFEFQLPR